jgi:hypothetical protein
MEVSSWFVFPINPDVFYCHVFLPEGIENRRAISTAEKLKHI